MRTLAELEQKIYKVQINYLEVSKALHEIRERKLFQEAGYRDFDTYLNERWALSNAYLKNIMKASAVAQDVSVVVNSVPTVTQALYMKSLTTPQRQELAKDVKDFKNAPVETIKAAVARLRGNQRMPRKTEPASLWGSALIYALEQTSLWIKSLLLKPLPKDAKIRNAVIQAAKTTQKDITLFLQEIDNAH